MVTIVLRPAIEADSEFCYQLHRAAARGYVQAIWGWDEATQRTFHHRSFRPVRTRIIAVDGRDIGSISIEHTSTETYLGRIEIHPDYQGQGTGTQLIRRLLDEATDHARLVELDVLVVNHRAHALYRRLGFRDIHRHGPDNIKIRIRYTPPTHTDQQRTNRT